MKPGARSSSDRPAVLLILVAMASNPAETCIVNIPFAFIVGNRRLPRGEYYVQLRQNVMCLFASDGSAQADCAQIRVANATPSSNGTLVFIESINSYILSKIFWPSASVPLRDGNGERMFPDAEPVSRDATLAIVPS